jgi:hypothetical protein
LLAAIPEGSDKAEGIRIGQTVADRILALRSNDGSTDTPASFVFGSAPGDFQSTPPNFPLQPQLTGRFWNGAIQNYWNEIAQTATLSHSLTTAQSARLFALLNLTFVDGVIAFYDAKYTYKFRRPVTAIREAATDGNPATLPNPNWLPEVGNTTPDPSYPGAHAVISEGGAFVLISFFRRDHFDFKVTSGCYRE